MIDDEEDPSRIAVRGDWKTTPLPPRHKNLALDLTLTKSEFEKLIKGQIPRRMEDKWFIFYEAPWLYLHRSWTGFCIYQVRFTAEETGHRAAEVLVNDDPAQY